MPVNVKSSTPIYMLNNAKPRRSFKFEYLFKFEQFLRGCKYPEFEITLMTGGFLENTSYFQVSIFLPIASSSAIKVDELAASNHLLSNYLFASVEFKQSSTFGIF